MKRNKLYTVNKGNILALGGLDFSGAKASVNSMIKNSGQGLTGNAAMAAGAANVMGALGKGATGGLFKGLSGALGASKLSSGAGAAIGALGAIGGSVGNQVISDGFETDAGSIVGNAGAALGAGLFFVNPILDAAVSLGSGIIGGGINRAFGMKTDQKKLNETKNAVNDLTSYDYANNFDSITGHASYDTNPNIFKGGWFRGGEAAEKNAAWKKMITNATDYADRSIGNNISNLTKDQIQNELANLQAFGGALDIMQQNRYFDTIDKRSDAIAGKNQPIQTGFTGGAKTFADGGLKASFFDEFGSDPIGAAVRYNQGLEAMAAQEEAKQIEAAREREYLDLQQRMANLETENRNMGALLQATTPVPVPSIATQDEVPEMTAPAVDDYLNLKNFIKAHEGFSSKAYQLEGEAAPTIGYGFYNVYPGTNRKVKMGDVISREEAEKGLDIVLRNIDKDLSGKVPNWDKLQSYQRDALRDLAYGTGTNGKHFRKKSRLMTALANEDWDAAEKELISKSASLDKYNKNLLRISKLRQNMFRSGDYSTKAFGGELGTNGTDFTNGLLYIDEGGSHESNPLDGVPMGFDSEGIPNLVEEGETVYNDYVFSDRMKVPSFMYKELGLGGVMRKKGKEMSFADASKKLAQESEQRPNDPISQAGLDASLSRLAEVQETERMRKQAKEYMGLNGYSCGGKIGRKFDTGGIKPYAYSKSWDGFKYYDPETGEYDKGYLNFVDNINQDWLDRIFSKEQPYGSMDRYLARNRGYALKPEQASALAKDRVYSDMHKAMAAAYDDYKAGINPKTGKKGIEGVQTTGLGDTRFAGITTPTAEDIKGLNTALEEAGVTGAQTTPYSATDTPKTYATWMRKAPVLGLGALALTDLLGLTNKPDYTTAGMLEAAADRAGVAPEISYNPIGDYMRYTPLDRQYYLNQLMANSRATDRAIVNASSPSRNAALLSSGYNTTLGLGNLARQAEEYNRAQYERTKEFNRKTNMFNSQMGLEADMANARYRQQAQSLGLSGLAQAAALREQADARAAAARSANLSNFLTSLGNIGRENFAINQLNTDRSRHYTTDTRGRQGYKGNSRSCGGKMKRK